jgi:hypothetical protein
MDIESYILKKEYDTQYDTYGIYNNSLYKVSITRTGYYNQELIIKNIPKYFNINQMHKIDYIDKCVSFYEQYINKFNLLSDDTYLDMYYIGIATKIPSNIFFNLDYFIIKLKELKIVDIKIIKKQLEGNYSYSGPGDSFNNIGKYKYNHIKIFLIDNENNKFLLFDGYDKIPPVYGNTFGLKKLVIYPEQIKLVEKASVIEQILLLNNELVKNAADNFKKLKNDCKKIIDNEKKSISINSVVDYLKLNFINNQTFNKLYFHIAQIFINDVNIICNQLKCDNIRCCIKCFIAEFYEICDYIIYCKDFNKVFSLEKIKKCLLSYNEYIKLGDFNLNIIVKNIYDFSLYDYLSRRHIIIICDDKQPDAAYHPKKNKRINERNIKINIKINIKLKEYNLHEKICLHNVPNIFQF